MNVPTRTRTMLSEIGTPEIRERADALQLEVNLDRLVTALVEDGFVPRGSTFLTAIATLVTSLDLEKSMTEVASQLDYDLGEVHYMEDDEAEAFLERIRDACHAILTAVEAWSKGQSA